ncbi:MAG: Fe2+-dependent dioxygenase [Cyanobacteria bacterium J06638_7]
MWFAVEELLSPAQARDLSQQLIGERQGWTAGGHTAGWHARRVKHNRQLHRACALHRRLAPQVRRALMEHPLVLSAALPLRLHGLLFSRCGPGDGYGLHLDNAFMGGGRSDLSFTLFLSDPDAYEGGDLVLDTPSGEHRVRLPAGHAYVYPSTLLHQVLPVRRGERIAAVGWIQSRVRQEDQRDLLFELDTARRALFQQQGSGEIFDLINRAYTNLLRRWGESD